MLLLFGVSVGLLLYTILHKIHINIGQYTAGTSSETAFPLICDKLKLSTIQTTTRHFSSDAEIVAHCD